MENPVEKIVADALIMAGISYKQNIETVTAEGKSHSIDFYLPNFNLWIEVCQFYTPRKIEQLSTLSNAILIQGKNAALAFAKLINQ